jgi:hypothetical protein
MSMDDTLAGWLVLREPADTAARSEAVTRALVGAVGGRDSVRVLDLGAGTGANVRYLAPHLPRRQQWLLADRDPELLTMVQVRLSSWAAAHDLGLNGRPQGCTIHGERLTCDIETRALDLGSLDDASLFAARDVVTASALLDLTSEQWLRTLAGRCRAAGAAALFALSYNGWSTCSPVEPEDDMVRNLLNRHQRTDKGLGGQAAGPEASALAVRCFTEAGYQVRAERSDWMLGSLENELQRRLVAGWADAAIELTPDAGGAIADWRRRRDGHIDTNRSRIVVGHDDMAAWLPE